MNKKIISTIVATLLISTSIPVKAATLSRLGGSNRFETAKLINNKIESKTLILVSAFSFADALSSTALVKHYDGEIHLVANELDSNTIDSLNKGEFEKAIIIGGTGVISTEIEKQLEVELGSVNVQRLGGANRYETSSLVAEKIIRLNETVPYTFIVSGHSFADALSVAPVAAMTGSPIILTNGTEISDGGIKSVERTLETVYKLGGPTIVGNDFDSEIGDYERLAGDNRYQTNEIVINEFKSLFTGNDVFVASGLDYPDALAGSALAGKKEAPIVFVSNRAEESAKSSVGILDKKNLIALGGQAVVSDSILNDLNKKTSDSTANRFSQAVGEEVLRLVNIERDKVGANPLIWSEVSAPYAIRKSNDMLNNEYFSHIDLNGNKMDYYMKQDGVHFTAWGENIASAWGIVNSPEEVARQLVQDMWMESEGHKANILSINYTELAVGFAYDGNKFYATQIFITK